MTALLKADTPTCALDDRNLHSASSVIRNEAGIISFVSVFLKSVFHDYFESIIQVVVTDVSFHLLSVQRHLFSECTTAFV